MSSKSTFLIYFFLDNGFIMNFNFFFSYEILYLTNFECNLFYNTCGVDQLVEIIKVLGTPTRKQIREMNPNYTDFQFPKIESCSWSKVFKYEKVPDEAIQFIDELLKYEPKSRLTPIRAFPGTTLHDGTPLPPLFNFTPTEYKLEPSLNERLVPIHVRFHFSQFRIYFFIVKFVPNKKNEIFSHNACPELF
eukprot:GSMAST32.ASY1.ANO1.734.1 assembled CDS